MVGSFSFVTHIPRAHESAFHFMTKTTTSSFSILQEKDKEKKEKEKDAKEKEKKVVNGHQFTPVASVPGGQCSQCSKAFSSKEAFLCTREYSHPADSASLLVQTGVTVTLRRDTY